MGYTVLDAKAFTEAEVEERWAEFWERHVATKGWTPPEREEAEEQLNSGLHSYQGWQPKNALLATEATDAVFNEDGEVYYFEDFLPVLTAPEAIVNARKYFDHGPDGKMPETTLAQDTVLLTMREVMAVEPLICGRLHKTAVVNGKAAYVAVGRFRLPVCQREFVWSLDQCARLIDSIWRGLPIGNLTATEIRRPPLEAADLWGISPATLGATSNMLIDGQQRATAIHRYISGVYPVYGKLFTDLPDDVQDKFLSLTVAVSTIKAIDFPQLMDLYDRLSAGGTAHDATERAVEAVLRQLATGELEFEHLEDGSVAVYVPDADIEVVMPARDCAVAQSVTAAVAAQFDDDAAAAELMDDPS